MKNYTTPRTLADCSFTTGYASTKDRPLDWQDKLVLLAGTFAFGFAIGMALFH